MRKLLIAMSVAALAGCVPDEKSAEPDASALNCGKAELAHLVGDPVESYDFKALDQDVRILPPGSVMTMDHRPDRLNVDVDGEDRITRLWCG